MVTIQSSREIFAPLDKVWDIVADIDNEPAYWYGIKSIKNISKNGNITEREVVIAFKESKCKQTVIIDPKKMVRENIVDGPIKGSKIITINSVGTSKTIIHVTWDVRLTSFMRMFSIIIKKHMKEGTEEALDRIATAAGVQ
jgi:ribosome-associated toxin RatA of RatAB toxin-antitoxin module